MPLDGSLSENYNGSESILEELNDSQKADLLKRVENCWEAADAARVRWMNERYEGLQLYWGLIKPKDFPFKNCANVHVPLIRTILDTLHSNILGSMDVDKPVSITPVGPEDVAKSKKIEKLLNWQFTTQVDYSDFIDKAVHSALLYGVAVVKVRYVIENGRKSYDGLDVEILPPERFLTPPDANDSDVDKMDYIIHELILSKSDLKKRMLSGMYETIPDSELDMIGEQTSRSVRSGEDYLENIRSLYSGIESINTSIKDKRHATVKECYLNYDYNDDGIEESIMCSVLMDRRKILRAIKWNRGRPFVLIQASYILNKALGESVPEVLKVLNQELDTLHNLNIDALVFANIPFFFFDPVAGYQPDKIHLAPGVGIPTQGPPAQAVYFPQTSTKFNEMSRAEQDLISYAERMMGAGANVQGVMQTKRVTATEIATIDRRSGIRFLTIFDRIRRGVKQVFKLALEYDKEYLPSEVQVRVTGLDAKEPIFETVKRDDLKSQVDIQVNGSSILDDQAEKTEFYQIYSLGMSNPLIARNEMAVYELTKDLFSKLGVKRIDSYIHRPEDKIPKNPDEEHNLFLQEEYVEPNIGENIEEHIKKHSDLINSKSFDLLSKKGKEYLLTHYSSTLKMKETIEKMQLIQKMQDVNSQLMMLNFGSHPMQMDQSQQAEQSQSKNSKQPKQGSTGNSASV